MKELAGSTNIIIISFVFSCLAICAVAARFRARRVQNAGFSWDDYTIVLGLLFAVGLGVDNIFAAIEGNLGDHIPLDEHGVPQFDQRMTVFLQTEFAQQLLSVLALLFIKLSILLFYRRVFRGNRFSVISAVLIAAVTCWGISFFFATLFECYPIEKVWTSLYGQPDHLAHCYNYLPMFYATAISNMTMDIIILTVPMPIVWKLKMPTRQKVAVSGIFLLGAFVVGISVSRIYFFYQAGQGFDHAYDVTYNLAPTLYWTQLEAAIGVICACLPTLRVLFADVSLEKLRSYASKFSLRSTSRGTSHAQTRWEGGSGKESASSSVRGLNTTCDAVAMTSFHQLPAQEQGIQVHKTVQQTRSTPGEGRE